MRFRVSHLLFSCAVQVTKVQHLADTHPNTSIPSIPQFPRSSASSSCSLCRKTKRPPGLGTQHGSRLAGLASEEHDSTMGHSTGWAELANASRARTNPRIVETSMSKSQGVIETTSGSVVSVKALDVDCQWKRRRRLSTSVCDLQLCIW